MLIIINHKPTFFLAGVEPGSFFFFFSHGKNLTLRLLHGLVSRRLGASKLQIDGPDLIAMSDCRNPREKI